VALCWLSQVRPEAFGESSSLDPYSLLGLR
jgi:hypothetical protein